MVRGAGGRGRVGGGGGGRGKGKKYSKIGSFQYLSGTLPSTLISGATRVRTKRVF